MKPARLKTPAVPVPATRAAFEALAVELGETMRTIDRANAELADQIARAKLATKETTAALTKEADAMFRALAGYAAAHRAELLPDDRKSISIAAGTIGWRLSNPAVKIEDEDAAIAAIEALGLAESFLRIATEIDKQAILAAPDRAGAIAGVAVEQTELFFFKPLDLDAEKVRKVAAGAAA